MLSCRGGHPSKAGTPIPALEWDLKTSVPAKAAVAKETPLLFCCWGAGAWEQGWLENMTLWGWDGNPVPQGLWALTQFVCNADPSLLVLLVGANVDSSWNVNTLPFHSFSLKDSPLCCLRVKFLKPVDPLFVLVSSALVGPFSSLIYIPVTPEVLSGKRWIRRFKGRIRPRLFLRSYQENAWAVQLL